MLSFPQLRLCTELDTPSRQFCLEFVFRCFLRVPATHWPFHWFQLEDYLPHRVSREGNAMDSVRLSVCPSVRLFPLCLLNRLTLNLSFCVCVGPDHSWPRIEGQGHRSRTKVNAVRLTSILDWWVFLVDDTTGLKLFRNIGVEITVWRFNRISQPGQLSLSSFHGR